MKVLMLNGSPRVNGNTTIALKEMEKIFVANGIEVDNIQIGNMDIRGCLACNFCKKNGYCIQKDIVNDLAVKLREADGLVVGSPVYFASANGTVMSLLHRLFYSTTWDKTMKVGASVAVARRGGLTATYDELNKFFGITGMPIVSGQYWNGVHGMDKGEAEQDAEGMQQMRTLANNMVFLMRSIALGKEAYGVPQKEAPIKMNFIH